MYVRCIANLIALLLYGICYTAVAQSPADVAAVDQLYKDGQKLFNTDLPRTYQLYKQGFDKAVSIGYAKGIADGYFYIATVHDNNSQVDSAIRLMEKALKLYDSLHITNKQSEAYGRLGLSYVKLSQPQKGLQYMLKGISVAEKNNDSIMIARTTIVLAMHYHNFNEFDKAMYYLHNAEKIIIALKDSSRLAHIYLNLGSTFRSKKQYDSSLYFNQRSIQLREQLHEKDNLVRSWIDRSVTYLDLEQPDKAIECLQHAESWMENKSDVQNRANISLCYAEAYMLQGKYAEARRMVEASMQLAKQTEQQQKVQRLKELMFKIYYLQGNRKEADKLYDEFIAKRDSIFSAEGAKANADMITRYETDKKEKQIAIQQLEISNQQKQAYVLYAIALALVIVSLLFYYRFSIKKKNEALLAQKNKQLQEANEQKEMLLREIHHRVKNNLQVISSLFNLQSRSTDNPDVTRVMNEGKSRLKSIALIHTKLYQEDHLSKIEIKDYVHQLAEYLINMYNTSDKQIKLDINAEDIMLDVDTAVPLGLILTELITNSLKYAFNKKSNGQMGIKIQRNGDNDYTLVFTDDGDGLPDNIDPGKSKSLGLRLIQSLAKQLSGNFIYQMQEQPTFLVRFKEQII